MVPTAYGSERRPGRKGEEGSSLEVDGMELLEQSHHIH